MDIFSGFTALLTVLMWVIPSTALAISIVLISALTSRMTIRKIVLKTNDSFVIVMTNIEYFVLFYFLSIAAMELQDFVNCYFQPGSDCEYMMLPTIVLLMITFFLGLLAFLIHSINYVKTLSSTENKEKHLTWSKKEKYIFLSSLIAYIIFAPFAIVIFNWVMIIG
jgi:hypothetical protein